jgi:primosomal protein N'
MDYECFTCGNAQDFNGRCHKCGSDDLVSLHEETENDNEYQYDIKKGN